MSPVGFSGAIATSEEYHSFRGSVPLRRITIGDEGKTWQVYDTGPREAGSPLVCLPPISGTADVFFKQCLALSVRGYRVLAAEWPAYYTLKEWCKGFKDLLDNLNLERVHLFGAALGGFLAQKFAEHTRNCPRVASLVLCNTFTDTSIFKYSEEAAAFWLMPSVVLKRLVMTGLEGGQMDQQMVDATDFILERLESLGHAELASRLTLTCAPAHVEPQNVNDLPVTIIDVFDECALTQEVREETYKFYPSAKLGHLKSGGNFPYLSRGDEVNLYLSIHLRNFESAI